MFSGLTEALAKRKQFVDENYSQVATGAGTYTGKGTNLTYMGSISEKSPTGFVGLANQGSE
jgi:hypothetical protein